MINQGNNITAQIVSHHFALFVHKEHTVPTLAYQSSPKNTLSNEYQLLGKPLQKTVCTVNSITKGMTCAHMLTDTPLKPIRFSLVEILQNQTVQETKQFPTFVLSCMKLESSHVRLPKWRSFTCSYLPKESHSPGTTVLGARRRTTPTWQNLICSTIKDHLKETHSTATKPETKSLP